MKPMRNVANKIFGLAAAGAMAMTPMSAFSQAAPANQNTTPVAAQVQQLEVQYIGVQDQTSNDARIVAANASHNKVAIVVWGGNQAIQQEAYNAALDLVDMGIPTAFVLAPDGNGLDSDAYLQIYAASTPRLDGTIANNGSERIREITRDGGIAAYRDAFPAQAAALSLR